MIKRERESVMDRERERDEETDRRVIERDGERRTQSFRSQFRC